jgi:type II secretory pathway pseudopilin PulG
MGILPMVHRLEAGATRRASMLLEVLVTVTIMALFMALIGAQILSAVQAAGLIERRQTSMLLAESITSRLQAGGFELTDQAQQLSGTFGTVYPGWGWRVGTESTDDPTLMRVHLQVLQGDAAQPDASVDSMTAITDMYTLWALPAKMDLVEDFGLSESDAAALVEAGIDPKNFNPAMLKGLNIADLHKQFPQLEALLAMYGIDPSMLATLDPETIKAGIEAYLAGGGTIPNLPGGGAAGGNGSGENGGVPGGNDPNNGNDNKNESAGSFDMNEVVKMLSSGDKAGAEAYIRAHENELNNKRGGGTSGGGNSGGNTGNAGGSGRGGGSGSGNSGNAGGGSGNTGGGGSRGGSGNTAGGNRGNRGGRR